MRTETTRTLIEVGGTKPEGDFVIAYSSESGRYEYVTKQAFLHEIRDEAAKANQALRDRIEKAEKAIRALSASVAAFGEALKEEIK